MDVCSRCQEEENIMMLEGSQMSVMSSLDVKKKSFEGTVGVL